MTAPTMHLRHVWRTLKVGADYVDVLALQQWHAAEGWEHESIVSNGGYWQDVPVVKHETETGPDA